MELRQLKYFVAIAQQGSFQSAANKLFIAQPALSRQIGQLEKELGTTLFDRRARGVTLTSAGQTFLFDVNRILADLEQTRKRVAEAAHGTLGHLSVGLIALFSWHRSVVGAISRFREDNPNIELTLSSAENSLMVQGRILQGTLDCGFMFNRLPDDKRLTGAKVLGVRFALAVPTSWRIARAKKVRLADVANEPFIWLPRETAPIHYDRMLMMCNQAGFSPHIAQYATTENSLLSMVAAGTGCAIIAVSSIEDSYKPDLVELLELSDIKISINLELVWRPENHSTVLRKFVQTVDSEIRAKRKRGA